MRPGRKPRVIFKRSKWPRRRASSSSPANLHLGNNLRLRSGVKYADEPALFDNHLKYTRRFMNSNAIRLLCLLFALALCSPGAVAQSDAKKPADDKRSPIVKETE